IKGSYGTSNGIIDLTPLQNVSEVVQDVKIEFNEDLVSLAGLDFTAIGGDFSIYYNAALSSIDGFNNLTTIGGELYIGYDWALNAINGFNNLQSVGKVSLSNLSLNSLSGFDSLTTIDGDLWFFAESGLEFFTAFSSLQHIQRKFDATYTQLKNLNGLSALSSVGGNFIISGGQMEDFTGLSSLTTIGGYVSLMNIQAGSFAGLENLSAIGGFLVIASNDYLFDISALENIDPDTIQDLIIVENPQLYVCDLLNFCQYLVNPNNPREIRDNAGSCLDEATVLAHCAGCDAPVDLDVEDITATSAKIFWTSNETTFKIEWGENGFTQGTGTIIPGITETFYELTYLQANTEYDLYIRTDCRTIQSDWTGPVTFRTLTEDYIYENEPWTPENPSGVATEDDNIIVINGETTLGGVTTGKNITINAGATLNMEGILNLYGDLTING